MKKLAEPGFARLGSSATFWSTSGLPVAVPPLWSKVPRFWKKVPLTAIVPPKRKKAWLVSKPSPVVSVLPVAMSIVAPATLAEAVPVLWSVVSASISTVPSFASEALIVRGPPVPGRVWMTPAGAFVRVPPSTARVAVNGLAPVEVSSIVPWLVLLADAVRTPALLPLLSTPAIVSVSPAETSPVSVLRLF
jgi:hypothetical protein